MLVRRKQSSRLWELRGGCLEEGPFEVFVLVWCILSSRKSTGQGVRRPGLHSRTTTHHKSLSSLNRLPHP